MIVEKYIRALLYEHDCVVIPEFGGFIAHYVSASIHPIRHTFLPPSKEIAFNEMLKLNDGLLISHVAAGEAISREEATSLVRKYAELLKEEIRRHQQYVFGEIGTLSLNVEQKLQFKPSGRVNYLTESFGLPEFVHRPVDRVPALPRLKSKDRPAAAVVPAAGPEEKPLPTGREDELPVFRQERRKSRSGWLFAVSVPLLFGAAASLTGYFLFLDNGKQALSSLNPFTALIRPTEPEDNTREEQLLQTFIDSARLARERVATAPVPATSEERIRPTENTRPESRPVRTTGWEVTAPEEKASVAKAADAKKTEVKKAAPTVKAAPKAVVTPSNAVRYYVIVGGFGVEKNAFKLKKQLIHKGFTGATVLEPGSNGLHKVSAADYDQAEAAAAKANELKGEFGSAVWVFKF